MRWRKFISNYSSTTLLIFVLQLWDVITDQSAIELIREVEDAQEASKKLMQHALDQRTSDNVTVVVIKFKNLGGESA